MTITAGVLIIANVPFKNLVYGLYFPILVLWFVALLKASDLVLPDRTSKILIYMILLSIILYIISDYLRPSDQRTADVLKAMSCVLDVIWSVFAILLFLDQRGVLNLWRIKKKTE